MAVYSTQFTTIENTAFDVQINTLHANQLTFK